MGYPRQRARVFQRLLARRRDRGSIIAAAGVGALAFAFWTSMFGWRLPVIGAVDALDGILAIEFITIHGFPILVVGATSRGTDRARFARSRAWRSCS